MSCQKPCVSPGSNPWRHAKSEGPRKSCDLEDSTFGSPKEEFIAATSLKATLLVFIIRHGKRALPAVARGCAEVLESRWPAVMSQSAGPPLRGQGSVLGGCLVSKERPSTEQHTRAAQEQLH